jgi:hypothetical protein
MRTVSRTQITQELDLATKHPRANNKHIRRILRWATDPERASTITQMLRHHNRTLLQAIDADGHLGDYSVLGILFRTDAAKMLKEADVQQLYTALDDAICSHSCSVSPPKQHVAAHLLHDPVGAVRTAYVLARDLAEVDFDDDPLDYDE